MQTMTSLQRLSLLRRLQAMDLPTSWVHLIDEVTGQDPVECERLLARLAQGEPLAYILGWWYFHGHRFWVNEATLVPRADSEVLIEAFSEEQPKMVVDWCSGSGCLGLSLALRQPDLQVYLLDVSMPALQVARANTGYHGLQARVQVVQADLKQPWPLPLVDAIVANVPYVAAEDIPDTHEPRIAFDGGEDGLLLMRALLARAAQYLVPQGFMVLEAGSMQEMALLAELPASGFTLEAPLHDLAGRFRGLKVRKVG